MKRSGKLLIALLIVAGPSVAFAQGGSKVAQTRHNLSSTGPGPVKVAGSGNLCYFCHTPHAANPIAPLWNREDPGTYYQVYGSSTLNAEVPQPSGTSRLCLSCHDGTIALTQTYNSKSLGSGTIYITSQDSGYIGTDLSDDHPISFVYDSALAASDTKLRDPNSLPATLPLDHEKRLQCTTCHDAHDDSNGMFLRMDNRESRMCVSCHNLDNWSFSSHSTSTRGVAGAPQGAFGRLTYSTVKELACESCHRPHTAGGRQRLLRYEAEEDNCLICHDGSVATENISTQLTKLSTHPVRNTTGVHDPVEDPDSMTTHVECADCHNPHESTSGPATVAPNIKPSMKGASGLTGSGTLVASAQFEYEVCYKCHSRQNPARAVVDRVVMDNNIANEFAPSSLSYHPVEALGKNMDAPSLLQPFTTTSRLYCTDCHSSDSGAAGPHGSDNAPLLKKNYTVLDYTPHSSQAYALCYSCHSEASILANQSFSKHSEHIVGQKTPCSACHDPHGVAQSTNLINFDRDIVKPRANGTGPTYTDTGDRRGTCALLCHNKDHDNLAYPN